MSKIQQPVQSVSEQQRVMRQARQRSATAAHHHTDGRIDGCAESRRSVPPLAHGSALSTCRPLHVDACLRACVRTIDENEQRCTRRWPALTAASVAPPLFLFARVLPQIKMTNVAIVRYKLAGKRSETETNRQRARGVQCSALAAPRIHGCSGRPPPPPPHRRRSSLRVCPLDAAAPGLRSRATKIR